MSLDKDYCCEDRGEVQEWTQIKVTVPLEHLDALVAVMSMISNQLQIEDYSDIDLKSCYGDLIDESILNADKTIASVSVYRPGNSPCSDELAFLREHMAIAGIADTATVSLNGVNEEDWANAWKAYYKPLHIGKRMVIVPAWERYDEQPGEIVVRMDPGMAFGTGSHETTRLVIGLLEKYTPAGGRMLDVGCGSGILAICASKLGAGQCYAYDIDPVAVKVANENIRDSGITNVTCEVSDLLRDVDRAYPYDLITANIVADIIIRMSPDVGALMHAGTVLLVSGIILERSDDVVAALEANGLKIVERVVENDWCAMAVMKK
ncbi:MAG: 50S ribosomal protein L11 methyltransferase [Ruminococcaceae bacterium]|nr:50S ribosomal protein L11 methyltransferase [Oscillospiraceae bacterium]